MKNRRSWILTMAVLAVAALELMLLTSDAKAGRGQTTMWPKGAQLAVQSYYSSTLPGWQVSVRWPLAAGADHYRMTVIQNTGKQATMWIDWSPAGALDLPTGTAYSGFPATPGKTYTIIVTAYSSPDERSAYSESLQTRITVR